MSPTRCIRRQSTEVYLNPYTRPNCNFCVVLRIRSSRSFEIYNLHNFSTRVSLEFYQLRKQIPYFLGKKWYYCEQDHGIFLAVLSQYVKRKLQVAMCEFETTLPATIRSRRFSLSFSIHNINTKINIFMILTPD